MPNSVAVGLVLVLAQCSSILLNLIRCCLDQESGAVRNPVRVPGIEMCLEGSRPAPAATNME
jgi:hypothetical protein